MDILGRTIYNVPPSRKTRTKPMEVLCLGLARTGTDSLRTALEDHLGYTKTSHGFTIASDGSEVRALSDIVSAQRRGELQHLSPTELAAILDTLFGDSVAVTDQPAGMLAHELLTAYPEAKVVLNTRDIDDWDTSIRASLLRVYHGTPMRRWRWFEAESFWLMRVWRQEFVEFFGGSFERHGREVFARHYAALEERLAQEGRPWLEWRVQDGWGPLCEFLGKPVPDVEFPSGNSTGSFTSKHLIRHQERMARAKRNAAIVAGAVIICGGIAFRLFRR